MNIPFHWQVFYGLGLGGLGALEKTGVDSST
jgi:hypothetical protein